MKAAVTPTSSNSLVRHRLHIRGTVQGVGFRPFIFRLAHAHRLTGKVWNDPHGVTIECQGTPARLHQFATALHADLPPLARIDTCDRQELPPLDAETEFLIVSSSHFHPAGQTPADAAITIDSAVCPDCLREMRDPADRRHAHPLINCTNCGPRFSIIREVPYDRPHTTMAAFPLCTHCAAEYKNPRDRRFHAQPVCCPRCGPRLQLLKPLLPGTIDPEPFPGNPIRRAAQLLYQGNILAIKGIGGFHLAVRADSDGAVARLRSLKQRDAKPFALLVRDVAAARALITLSPAGEQALTAPEAPILLGRRLPTARVADAVAPGTHLLGVMLPYTPIHHLLLDALRPLCADSLPALVMTSGNLSSEPLVIDNHEALARLSPLCDALLLHDRPIERPVDDSVLLDVASSAPLASLAAPAITFIRRSRGFVPIATPLPEPLASAPHPTGLCLGGELKNTIAILRQRDIIVSQHLGDLGHPRALEHFHKAIADLVRLFDVRVDFIAHDLHPGYLSTRAAHDLAARHNARLIPIQHHHAHAAAVFFEHALSGPALALICDGTGFGPDNTIWGGELLRIENGHFRRLGRLKPMRLPGGDAAARDPRRSALSLLHAVFGDDFIHHPAAQILFPDPAERQFLASMISRGINSPWTSSTGRLFDAVAALLGISTRNDHEAQAAMALEAAAHNAATASLRAPNPTPPLNVTRNESLGLWELDPAPLVTSLLQRRDAGVQVAQLAADFHDSLARGFIALAVQARAVEAVDLLLFSGGVFCNAQLTQNLAQTTAHTPFRAFFHKSYPPTDGGVAFGQAAAIAARLLTGSI